MPHERTFLQYESSTGERPVWDWYDKLDDDFKAKLDLKFTFYSQLPDVKPPHFTKLEAGFFELRAKVKAKTVRIYMTPVASGPDFIFVLGDIKKRKSVSRKIKKQAKSRIKEISDGSATASEWGPKKSLEENGLQEVP